MHKQIYLNIAVADLDRSKAFFKQIGFDFEPKFSNEQGACMIVGDNIFTMLLTRPFFQTFTGKPLNDARETTEVLICLSCDSRAEVDELVAKAIAAGGAAPRKPQDYGFMYSHGFEDLDGHIWELAYMDPNADCPA
ncbi:glyoxalase/bleomycin resistance/extradiol dioxygenase family protein [Chitinimonas arctica]|uniref:Glyoxalase/bleomycin resistance/extradiol dioxygenase family protein n=1 Tax=Chitinimonas arctica TaxID=2594795 RepID=A0A516SGW7_9NEIS|nr:VOC family protein [Chitinimonas arctica]QDQ27350.1 glyoxalase/bleomycin resistance/extradiol dioxygenase family protein [Chitinimonas arctica]